jgi:predicted porin
MKKTLMALAVGAAFAAPSAFADVTISGSINMALEVLKVGEASAVGTTNNIRTSGGQGSLTNTGVSTNYSNVTISSTDDIGNGMKVDFAYQITAPTANNSTVSNRNSHIGIVSDSWGGVWYGSNENIYERYLYTIDPIDGAAGLGGNLSILGNPGNGHVFDAVRGNPAGTGQAAGFYRRDEQSVWYDSPNWNGFTFGAAIGTQYAKTATTNPGQWEIGAKYASPAIPLAVWAAYAQHKDYFGLGSITANTAVATGTVGAGGVPAGLSSKDNALQLGLSYTLGDIVLFGVFEQLKYQTDGQTVATAVDQYKRTAYNIGLKWNLATGYVGAQYIQAQNGSCEAVAVGCSAANTGAKMIGVAYYHTLTKQSQAFIAAQWLRNSDLGNYITAGIGNDASGKNFGATYTGVGIGLKHSF